jgi:hypothetical protein
MTLPLSGMVRWGILAGFRGQWNYPQRSGTRPVIAHTRIYDALLERLRTAYHHMAAQAIGNPLEAGTPHSIAFSGNVLGLSQSA